ncbi:hypothetical protein [Bradyrhizobium australiense]|uniref:Uncharacterized protein n=1 Tax=Bradyrhizobium australiense TaxID=2721161 RepID=A0A7Y4LYU8_9BRAD|nr:hypothetical protein [Bradyrhizobium australiense]NOJ43649.1 hypothetical protein [Bradyrhizobium australiense]
MRLTGRTFAVTVSAALILVAAIAVLPILSTELANKSVLRALRPVWTEAHWPFPTDPWGKGKAFRCRAADCGSEVHLYVRAKLGFCNCATGIADDTDLEQMGDLALIGGQAKPLGAGRPITVGSMRGRTRAYSVSAAQNRNGAVISLAFNQRCDMVAATVLLQHGASTSIEPAVLEFLNSEIMLKWAETTLGL